MSTPKNIRLTSKEAARADAGLAIISRPQGGGGFKVMAVRVNGLEGTPLQGKPYSATVEGQGQRLGRLQGSRSLDLQDGLLVPDGGRREGPMKANIGGVIVTVYSHCWKNGACATGAALRQAYTEASRECNRIRQSNGLDSTEYRLADEKQLAARAAWLKHCDNCRKP